MSKRYTVLGMSVVLALALAVPALGGPSNPVASTSASVKKTANKALKRANQAKKQAKNALDKANSANSSAASAQNTANRAEATANGAQSVAAAAQSAAAAAQAAADAADANANTRIKDSHQIFGSATPNDADASKTASASCPSAEPVLGGGFVVGGTDPNEVTVTTSDGLIYGHGWFVSAEAISGMVPTWQIQAVVMCGTK